MSASSNKNLDGINIHDALSILSLRAKSGGERELTDRTNQDKKGMGQTINLFQSEDDECKNASLTWDNMSKLNGCGCMANGTEGKAPTIVETADEEEKRKQMEKERKERELKIRLELENLSVKDLLNAILGVQKDRVLAYKEFDSALEKVLKTGNISMYPTSCAKATASFSVLSSSINTMNEILLTKKLIFHKVILQLQSYEKEKLNITAALHLEQIRKHSHLLSLGYDENESTKNDRILKLLNDGIVSLKRKITTCIENINDLIDELRCEIMDEED